VHSLGVMNADLTLPSYSIALRLSSGVAHGRRISSWLYFLATILIKTLVTSWHKINKFWCHLIKCYDIEGVFPIEGNCGTQLLPCQ
jgi:hypothetical protein